MVRTPVSLDSYESDAFVRLERIEAESFWFRARNALVLWLLRRHFPNAESFLEVGCGTGFVLAGVHSAFPSMRIEGVEPYADGIEVASRRLPDVPILECPADRMPYRECFDVVGSFDVLEHIEDDVLALERMYDAVVPGGGILLAVPQHPWLWSAADEYARHQRRYRKSELVHRAQGAGFEILRASSFMTVTLPLMVASRLAYRVFPSRSRDPLGDLELPNAVNRTLEALLAAERGLLRLGVDLPAGGSLFLVGRRPGR